MKQVAIYDTTLRDGAQGEGVSFTIGEKLEVVRLLDEFGVDYIEGGWPGSNAKDLAFFEQLKGVELHHAKVVAFTSTRRKGQKIQTDEHMKSVLGTGLKHCAVVGKTWDFHVEKALRTTPEENLAMISDTVAFLKEHDIEVLFDAEHFFDAYKNNPDYALQALRAASEQGADWLVLCDTNGGAMPHEIEDIVAAVAATGLGPLAIHTHNDGGLAVANSIAAVRAGASQVQGTINGFGERCGNTDLCTLIPNLLLKLGYASNIALEDLTQLKGISDRLYQMTEKTPVDSAPFVGRSAFAHKAGIHVSAILRDPKLYEHVAPEQVGNERRVLLSELSGESNVLYQLNRFGLPAPSDAVKRILRRLKEAEYQGYLFDGAETSLELIMREELNLVGNVLDGFETLLERVTGGYAARVIWTESTGGSYEGAGHGPSVAQALCHAMRYTLGEMVVHKEQVVQLPMQDENHQKYRAHLAVECNGDMLTTVGLADTEQDAVAEAVMQIIRYLKSKDEVAADSSSKLGIAE